MSYAQCVHVFPALAPVNPLSVQCFSHSDWVQSVVPGLSSVQIFVWSVRSLSQRVQGQPPSALVFSQLAETTFFSTHVAISLATVPELHDESAW